MLEVCCVQFRSGCHGMLSCVTFMCRHGCAELPASDHRFLLQATAVTNDSSHGITGHKRLMGPFMRAWVTHSSAGAGAPRALMRRIMTSVSSSSSADSALSVYALMAQMRRSPALGSAASGKAPSSAAPTDPKLPSSPLCARARPQRRTRPPSACLHMNWRVPCGWAASRAAGRSQTQHSACKRSLWCHRARACTAACGPKARKRRAGGARASSYASMVQAIMPRLAAATVSQAMVPAP